MVAARFVQLEGVRSPCIILLEQDQLPEELVVSFDGPDAVRHPEVPRKGQVVYRLVPRTASEPEPVYREIFDE